MANYLKNFLLKLLLLPIIVLMGGFLLLLFLFHPSFKLTTQKVFNQRGQHGHKKEDNKDYEAFY